MLWWLWFGGDEMPITFLERTWRTSSRFWSCVRRFVRLKRVPVGISCVPRFCGSCRAIREGVESEVEGLEVDAAFDDPFFALFLQLG